MDNILNKMINLQGLINKNGGIKRSPMSPCPLNKEEFDFSIPCSNKKENVKCHLQKEDEHHPGNKNNIFDDEEFDFSCPCSNKKENVKCDLQNEDERHPGNKNNIYGDEECCLKPEPKFNEEILSRLEDLGAEAVKFGTDLYNKAVNDVSDKVSDGIKTRAVKSILLELNRRFKNELSASKFEAGEYPISLSYKEKNCGCDECPSAVPITDQYVIKLSKCHINQITDLSELYPDVQIILYNGKWLLMSEFMDRYKTFFERYDNDKIFYNPLKSVCPIYWFNMNNQNKLTDNNRFPKSVVSISSYGLKLLYSWYFLESASLTTDTNCSYMIGCHTFSNIDDPVFNHANKPIQFEVKEKSQTNKEEYCVDVEHEDSNDVRKNKKQYCDNVEHEVSNDVSQTDAGQNKMGTGFTGQFRLVKGLKKQLHDLKNKVYIDLDHSRVVAEKERDVILIESLERQLKSINDGFK